MTLCLKNRKLMVNILWIITRKWNIFVAVYVEVGKIPLKESINWFTGVIEPASCGAPIRDFLGQPLLIF